MPPKFRGASGTLVNGMKCAPERLQEIRDATEREKAAKEAWELKLKFKVEPEEIKTLEAIAKMPEHLRAPAAEGALLARRWRKLGRP